MARRRVSGGLTLLLATLLAGAAWQAGEAGVKKSDSKVKTEAKAGADGTITVNLVIDKGWHIYANPVGNEDLDGAKTVIEVKAGGKALKAKVEYPKGIVHKDKVIGDYSIYEEKVSIPVRVERAAGDTSPLEISVKFQACDSKQCLLPATVKVTVK